VCYDAFGTGRSEPKDYLANLIGMGHESVFEHASWTFAIRGVSRVFSHEHVRHRIGVAISQRSQRYVDEADSAVIEQPLIAKNKKAQKEWEKAVKRSQRAYKNLVKFLMKDLQESEAGADLDKSFLRKIARSAARSVLPSATETTMIWSANARTLRHYLELRGSKFAEFEIRRVANQIYEIMKDEAPNMVRDFYTNKLGDGTYEIIKDTYGEESLDE